MLTEISMARKMRAAKRIRTSKENRYATTNNGRGRAYAAGAQDSPRRLRGPSLTTSPGVLQRLISPSH